MKKKLTASIVSPSLSMKEVYAGSFLGTSSFFALTIEYDAECQDRVVSIE